MRDRIRPVYYKKLLRSTLLLFLLPALTSVVLASVLQAKMALKNAVDLQTSVMEKISAVVDRQLNTGIQMAVHCASDSFFVDMARQEFDLFAYKETSRRLVSFCVANAYVDDIIILYKNKPMNCAASGIYPNNESVTALYIDGMLPEQFFSDGKNQFAYSRATISRSGVTEDTLLYVLPSSIQPNVTVAVVMKAYSLFDMLKYMQGQAQGSFDVLFNRNGEFVLSSKELDEQTSTMIMNLAASETSDTTLTIAGKQYLAIKKYLAGSDITYLHFELMKSLWWPTQMPIMLFIALFLLTAGIAFVIIRFVVDRNYQPVKTLYADIGDTGSIPEGMDEFSAISLAFHNLKALIGTYDATLKNQMPANRMRLLSNLISGYYDSIEDFNLAAAYTGIKLTMPYFWVALMSCDKGRFEDNLAAYMEASLPPTLEAFGARTHNPREYVFVFAGMETVPISGSLEDALHRCALNMQVSITITLSQRRTDLSKIGQAYIECCSLHTRVNGNGKLNQFVSDPEDLINLIRASGDLQEVLNALQEAILDGNVDGVMRELQTFSKSIDCGNFSYFEKQCICYDLVNCVIHALCDLFSNDEFTNLKLPDLTELVNFQNESDLIRTIGELSRLVSDELFRSSLDRKPQKPMVDDVIAYIHAHCADYDFSVKQLADRHGMSLSMFSQHFKANFGMTAIAYILKCRIDRAKYLLENTDMTISDIVLAIGYISVPTFTNKFKQECGITPGEYRERVRETNGGASQSKPG